jgi:hypothetical protein
VVTQSGSNQLHGAVFEFLRNNKLDARNFSIKRSAPLRSSETNLAARWAGQLKEIGCSFSITRKASGIGWDSATAHAAPVAAV